MKAVFLAVLFPFLFLGQAFAQNIRWDSTASTTVGVGTLVPILAMPGSSVAFFNACTSDPCSPTRATTYTSASATTTCPSGAQVVWQLPYNQACTSFADSRGNFGAYFQPGVYEYTVTHGGLTYGPFQFNVGGGNSGGGGAPSSPSNSIQLANSPINGFASDPLFQINPTAHLASMASLRMANTFTVTPQTIRGIVAAFAGQSTTNGSTFMDIFPDGYNPWLSGITFEDYAVLNSVHGAAITLGLANDAGDSQGIQFLSQRTSSFDSVFNLFTHNGILTWAKTADSAVFGGNGVSACIEVSAASRYCWDQTNGNALVTGGGTNQLFAGVALGVNNGNGSSNFNTTYVLLCDQNSSHCGIGGQKTDASLDPWNVDISTGDMNAHAATVNSLASGSSTVSDITIGSGNRLTRYGRYNAFLTFGAVAASSCTTEAATVTGVAAGDFMIAVLKPTIQSGLTLEQGIVTGANTVSFQICNVTLASITPTAGELYQFVVVQ